MSDQIRLIAARMKELREISDVSLESLANALNIAVDTYRQYESGTVDIPVSFLYEVASYFKVELTEILTGDKPKLHSYSLVRKGKGISVDRRKEYKYQNLAYNFVNKKAEPFLVSVEPSAEGEPIHYNSHSGQEFNYVLEGTLKIVIDGHELILNEGDSLYFDSGLNHGMQAIGGKTARFLAIIL